MILPLMISPNSSDPIPRPGGDAAPGLDVFGGGGFRRRFDNDPVVVRASGSHQHNQTGNQHDNRSAATIRVRAAV